MSKTDHGKSKICELLSQLSSFARFVYGVLASDCSNCQRFPRICDDVAWFNDFRSRWHQHIWNLVAFPLKVEYCIQHCGTLNSYVVHCAKLRLVGIYICVMFACVGVPSGTFLQINLSFDTFSDKLSIICLCLSVSEGGGLVLAAPVLMLNVSLKVRKFCECCEYIITLWVPLHVWELRSFDC